jgi:quinol-cytochrome oxidoreductase complex cytochrome b subunit
MKKGPNLVVKLIANHLKTYPTSATLNYALSFGSLLGFSLVIQLITGVFLATYYIPDTLQAFDSIERIMRDVNNGWLLRYMHSNGASMYFILMYCHMCRGVFVKSYSYSVLKMFV